MENVEKLSATIKRFVDDANSIKKMKTFDEVGKMERQCVQELQAVQMLSGMAGRDLYNIVQERKKELKTIAVKGAEK